MDGGKPSDAHAAARDQRQLALTRGLNSGVVVVVLPTPAVAELFVFASLAALTAEQRRSVRDDTSAVLTARQIAGGSQQPVHLQVDCTEQVPRLPGRYRASGPYKVSSSYILHAGISTATEG